MTIKMIDADNNEIIVPNNGYYVVDVTSEQGNREGRTIAERFEGEWLQLGSDYDIWQYSRENYVIRVVAWIDIDKLKFDVV